METLKNTSKPRYKVYKEEYPYRIKYKNRWIEPIYYNYFDAKEKAMEFLEAGARYVSIVEEVVHTFMEKKVWMN